MPIGTAWVVLSAKYGFIAPDFSIPAPYEVSFKCPATGPIAFDWLRHQVREQQLGRDPVIVGLGARRRGGMVGAHSICDCYDFAIPVGTIREVRTSGGMFGAHTHVE